MKIVLLMNIVSEHQLPLAREIVRRVGEDNYRYVYLKRTFAEREKLGWKIQELPKWCVPLKGNERLLEEADCLYSGERRVDLFERRTRAGKITVYCSERWFRPRGIVPGKVRLLNPKFFLMTRRMVRWLNQDERAKWLAIGPKAKEDAEWIGVDSEKILPWGYFVSPSVLPAHGSVRSNGNFDELRLLWVGRMLPCKRVEDIIQAVRLCNEGRYGNVTGPRITLDVFGVGPQENYLKKMVSRLKLCDLVRFAPPVPMNEVRALMRNHDLYVFSSNAREGWGAVVSEALEEGMRVIGTYEAGSSATLLPQSNLYHAGDYRRLAEMIRGDIPRVSIGKWTAEQAAIKLLSLFCMI